MTVTLIPVSPETHIKRDHWQRYLIPDPDTGKERAWTRATTIANTLADRFGLEKWSKRNVALGLAARSDLYARVASCKATDTKALDALVSDAEEAAAASSGANLGTALHRFTERLDAGEDIVVPPPWDRDVEAYRATMQAHGITVEPRWIERVLVIPELGAAGMCDRLLTHQAWDFDRIGDLKTGKDVLRYGMTEIAIQLSIYAQATHWFDPKTEAVYDITDRIDQEHALVMHLPVGQATCTLYDVNIEAGWDAVQLAMDVRKWRRRHDLAEVLMPPLFAPEPIGDQIEWVRDRVQTIKDAGHGADLAAEWSQHPDVPTFPKGGPTTVEHVDQIAMMCDRVEAAHAMPFGPTNPAAPPATKRKSNS